MGPWHRARDNARLTAHVARRDLRGLAREPWTYALAGLLLGLIGAATLAGLPGRAPASTAVALYTQRVATLHTFALYAAALLAVPYLATHAVRNDRPDTNGALLALTCLRPAHIVFGKALAAWGMFALTAIASLPITGLVLFFSGVDLKGFTLIVWHLGAFALCTASVGATIGTGEPSPVRSWFYAIFLVVLLSIYPVIFGYISLLLLNSPALADLLFSLTPFSIRSAIVVGPPRLPVYPYLSILYPLLCAVAAIALAARRWRKLMFDREELPTLPPGNTPDGAVQSHPIPDGANLVFERERQLRGGHSDDRLLYSFLFGVFWGLFALLMDTVIPAPGAAGTRFDLSRALAVLAFAPPLAARVIAREQEQHTLDQLRLTALSARAIIAGKMRTLVRVTLPFLIGLYLMTSVNSFLFDRESFALVTAHCLIWLPVYFLFISRCAMLAPLLAPGAVNSLVAAYGFAALGALLHLLVVGLIMVRNPSTLLSRADPTGLAIFWCIDAVLLYLMAIPLLGILARALQTSSR